VIVTCRSCHRVEERPESSAPAGSGVVVRAPGGLRRAPVPERAALETLLASARGEVGPVVAACPACGLPMVAEGPAPSGSTPSSLGAAAVGAAVGAAAAGGADRIPWVIGLVRFEADGRVVGPEGPLSQEEAERLLDRVLPRSAPVETPGFGLFQGSLLVFMLAPLAVWLFSIVFVSVFLYRFPVPGPGGP
jgi:hypothetical protein